MSTISYVIPVFQNRGTIEATWQAVRELFADALNDHQYELVFVDDGSSDGSWDEIRAVCARDPAVRAVRFARNFGQLAAIVAGLAEARGDAVVNLSADLQDPVELSAEMVRSWLAGHDVVVAYRSDREDALGARFFSRLAYGTLRLSNPGIPAGGFDYVLMSRLALQDFLGYRGRNRFFQGDVLWAGRAAAFLPYTRRARTVGRSQYTFGKKLKLFFDFVLDGSYLPIRLMSVSGVVVALGGAAYAAAIAVSWLFGATPFPGWAPIMVAVLLIGGMTMLMLGVIGEYLWRILDEIKAKPLYVVAERDRDGG
jgi:polyisoprenyl-phosphate glycosyltransferase